MKPLPATLAILLSAPVSVAAFALGRRAGATRAERLCARKIARATSGLVDMSASFDRHPDALVYCDLSGYVLRVNRAQVALSGIPEKAALGRHFTSFVDANSRTRATEAFARGVAGDLTALEMQLREARGESIDVASHFFGTLANGTVTGVTIASKSMVQVKRMQALDAAHAQRIASLYEIACGYGRSYKQQMDDALQLAAAQLGYDCGGVTEIVEDTVTILSTVGSPEGMGPNSRIPLADSLAEFVVRGGDVWEVGDLPNSRWRNYPSVRSLGLVSVVAMPIAVASATYGTYYLASKTLRTNALSEADRSFIRLVAALLGSMIERKRQEQKLDSLAFFDGLTGLPNRVLITEKLEQAISAADRHGTTFSVLYLDLDRFKDVNDRAGHAIGDRILHLCAQRMQQCIRPADTVGRFGGDEFVVIQTGPGGRDGAAALAERLGAALEQPFLVDDVSYGVGVSVGIGTYPGDGRDSAALLESADKAMYRAKRTARGRTHFAPAPEALGSAN